MFKTFWTFHVVVFFWLGKNSSLVRPVIFQNYKFNGYTQSVPLICLQELHDRQELPAQGVRPCDVLQPVRRGLLRERH